LDAIIRAHLAGFSCENTPVVVVKVVRAYGMTLHSAKSFAIKPYGTVVKQDVVVGAEHDNVSSDVWAVVRAAKGLNMVCFRV